MKISSSIAGLALGAALIAWLCAGYFYWSIQSQEADYTKTAAQSELQMRRQSDAVLMHAFAQSTLAQRTDLAGVMNVDIASIVDMIESVAPATGVTITLGDATQVPTTSGDNSVNAVGFTVDARGSFAAIMRAEKLFEMLPVPSTLTALEIERVSDPGAVGQWHLSASIHVFTTLNLSS